MLSFQLCKKYLKNNTYTNQQTEEIRDKLYQLAEILVSSYISNKKNSLPTEKVKEIERYEY
jgi:hypothetical protein